jgi:imidazolonepropionase
MSELGLIEDGAVLIVDGVIREVGPSRRVERLALSRDAVEFDASGKVVMPGFVDCHTRLISGPARLNDYEAGTGTVNSARAIWENVRHVRACSKQRLSLEARKHLRQFMKHGTTMLDARTGFGLNEAVELKMLRVLGQLDGQPLAVSPGFFAASICPPEFTDRPADYIDWVAGHMIPELRRRRLACFIDVACGTATGFSAALAGRVLSAAQANRFPVRVSTGECSATTGAVPLAISGRAASIDGLVRVSPEDVAALASSNTVAALLPGRSFSATTEPLPPARTLIDGGVAVAIATGFDSTSSPSCSMPMMMSLACAQMKMKPAEAVTAATVNAACALRRDHCAGSLQSGKAGDLVVLQTGDYREAAFRFGINLVNTVIRGGEVIFPRVEEV